LFDKSGAPLLFVRPELAMPIDFDTEHVRSMSQAARELPVVRGTKPPHPGTLDRWAITGIKSASGRIIKLESAFVGSTRVTSLEALRRFFERRADVEFKPLPESDEKERKRLEEQAAESMERMRSIGMI
jgi:hypothetical protein